MTHGERNNNPGNLRHGQPWAGLCKVQKDPDYCQFNTPRDGIRAMALCLLNYQRLHGLHNLRDLIARWAPPTENNTDAYLKDVCARTQLPALLPLDLDDPVQLTRLVRAIIWHENGEVIYPPEVIEAAVKAALK